MLKINAMPTFTRPVRASFPEGEGTRDDTFKATFRLLPIDQFAGFDLAEPDGLKDFLVAAIVSLDDIEDRDGPVAYSDEVRDAVLNLAPARQALLETYVKAAGGASEGN